ncbi:hypothetical protein ACFLSV_07865 [Bacteroidota bacterium]
MRFNYNDKKNIKVLKDSPYPLDYPHQIRKAPNKSGLYMLLNEKDEVIYIGKTENGKLKKEIKSNVGVIVNGEASKYRWFITANDKVAEELEKNWIEKYNPPFNQKDL